MADVKKNNKSKSTKNKSLPKNVQSMSKEQLEDTLKKKKVCNQRAHSVVEQLIAKDVSTSWFLDNLQYINQSHFQDCIEERSISRLCGYPLCDKELTNVPKQQYTISSRYNKVFDITERKQFCSNTCYKIACHVKRQLFTSPLWMRDVETVPKYTLVQSDSCGSGTEVDICIIDKSVVPNCEDPVPKIDSNSQKTKTEPLTDCVGKILNRDQTENSITLEKTELPQKNVIPVTSLEVKQRAIEQQRFAPFPERKVQLEPVSFDKVKHLETCVTEWFTIKTYIYLYGKDAVKNVLEEQDELLDQIEREVDKVRHSERYSELCRRLKLLDFDPGEDDTRNLQPLPDYSILKEEGEKLQIKVRAFYTGQLDIKERVKSQVAKAPDEPEATEEVLLPVVDTHAQSILRRKILMDRLNNIVPSVLAVLQAATFVETKHIRDLVAQLDLHAHNITFKPVQNQLLGVIIIKLLALKNKQLAQHLHSKDSELKIKSMLLNYELPETYLDDLMQRICNCQALLAKFSAGS